MTARELRRHVARLRRHRAQLHALEAAVVGVPLGLAPYVPEEWSGTLLRVGIGGAILLVGVYLYVVIMGATAFSKVRETEKSEIPQADSMYDPQFTPSWLDRWAPWLVGTFALIIIAYGPQLIVQITNIALNSPGGRAW